MSELMNAIRARAERAKQQDFIKQKIDFFKPKKGENLIRLLPHWTTLDETRANFVERKIHFLPVTGNGGRMVKVPARNLAELGEEDLVARYMDEIEARDPNAAKDLRPTVRIIFNVIEYDAVKRNENPIKVWPISNQLAQKLWLQAQEAGSSCVNLESDFDWKVFKKIDPSKGQINGVSYEVILGRQKTSVPQIIKEKLSSMTNLDEIYNENMRDTFIKVISAVLGRDITNEVGPSRVQTTETTEEMSSSAPAKLGIAPPVIDEEDDIPFEPTAKTTVEDDVIKKELESLGLNL